MTIGIIGENCSGKSSLAEAVQSRLGGESVTGKDYLRMAKSESEAKSLFLKKLEAAVHRDHVIYVISEPEHIDLLPVGAIKVLVTADLDTVKERFRTRMYGNLPVPIEKMLERNHGRFDSVAADYYYDGVHGDSDALCAQLLKCSAE